MKRSRGVFAPKILLPLLAVGAIGVGAVGVLSLLDRRGEAAINLIPADAMLAVSFDNTPAPNQVLLFREISNAMEDSGLNSFVDDMMDNMGMPPEARAIKDNLKGSFAIGVWGDMMQGSPDMLLAAALHSPGSAEKIVAQHAQKVSSNRAAIYTVDEDVVIAFHQDYVIVTNSLKNIERALDASEQKIQSFAKTTSFTKARESLPAEASLMVFVNGAAVANADEATRGFYDAIGLKGSGWAAFSATVLAEGIQLDAYQEMEQGHAVTESVNAIPNLTYASVDQVPQGALAMIAVSGLGTMLKSVPEIAEKTPDAESFDGMLDEMKAETGMDFNEDIIPALAGEAYFAVYPRKDGEEPGFLLMFDKQNGASPDAAARKLIAKEGGFTTKKAGDVELFSSPENEAYIAIGPSGVAVSNDPTLVTPDPAVARGLSGSLAKFDQGAPVKMKGQIDLRRILAMIGESDPEASQALSAALSQDTLEFSVSVENGVVKSRALIPLRVPELLREIGKQAKQYQDTMDTPFSDVEGMGEFEEVPFGPEDDRTREQLMSDAKDIASGLKAFAKEHGGNLPTYIEWHEGKFDGYLDKKEKKDNFVYLPAIEGDPRTTETGFFMSDEGRIIVFVDGSVKFESYTDMPAVDEHEHEHDHDHPH